MIIKRQNKLNKLGYKADSEIRDAVRGSEVEDKVNNILDKSSKEMRKEARKSFSKSDIILKKPDIKFRNNYEKTSEEYLDEEE